MTKTLGIRSLGRREQDYLKALRQRLDGDRRDWLAEIKEKASDRRRVMGALLSSETEPTYENTIMAAEVAEEPYQNIMGEYRGLMDLCPTDKMRAQEKAISKVDTEEAVREIFDSRFAERVKRLYLRHKREVARDIPKLVTDYYRGFLIGGAYLSPRKKAILANLERKLSKLELEYSRRLDKSPKHAFFSHKSELVGLGKKEVLRAKREARGLGRRGWAMRLEPTLAQPAAAKLKCPRAKGVVVSAATRRGQRLEDCAIEIARVRRRIAGVLGFRSWADLKFFEAESGKPNKVWKLFREAFPSVRRILDRDIEKAKEHGWTGGSEKTPLWSFLPEDESSELFNPVKVLESGCFEAARRLFGLEFARLPRVGMYHPDVRTYAVFEKGRTLGFILVDLWQRERKGEGAWAIAWDSRLTEDKFPAVSLCCNFNKDSGCNMEGVTTIFHEFGHVLHALFTSHLPPSHVGLESANDFVEIPSQIAEHWAYDPSIYSLYAQRQSGERTSSPRNAVAYGSGAAYLGSLVSAGADLVWHGSKTISKANNVDKKAASLIAPGIKNAEPRYKSPYFEHIFNSGYDASYYAYLWCELKAGQIQNWVIDMNGLGRKVGTELRKHIYSVGGDRNESEVQPWGKHRPQLFFEFREPLPRATRQPEKR
jgi:peptidyl-dipeptidase Dcp